MNRHRLIDYQKLNNTLVPDASLLGEIANTDWWTACSELFDDIIWQNYYDRTVLITLMRQLRIFSEALPLISDLTHENMR